MGNGLATVRAQSALARSEDERRWIRLEAKARVYAGGSMVPKEMVGKPDMVFAGMLLCNRLGVSEDSVSSLYVIEGHLDIPAWMMLAAAHHHGFETAWVRSDREAAVLSIRQAASDRPWFEVSFTVDDAAAAGYLDEWTEHWVPFTRADKSKGNRLEKFVLGREGVTVPDWVKEEIAAGHVKRKDNWHQRLADMLATKAARRAVRLECPEVLFGVAEELLAAGVQANVVAINDDDDDAEIIDGEIVPEADAARPAAGMSAGARSRGPAAPVDPAPATRLERALLKERVGLLPSAVQAVLAGLVAEAGLPKIAHPSFTSDDGARLAALVAEAQAKTEADLSGRPGAEDAGPGVEPGPAPHSDPEDDGRPFDA